MAEISNSIFVVHGRNEEIRKAMFSFLRSLGLKPLEWEKIVKATKKTSPYIGEVLDKGFEMAQAVVVVMTPDDEARLKKEFHGKREKTHEKELTGQPRPNVLIEAGMALGRNQDKTIIVEIGEMRDVSDLLGRNVVKMDGSAVKRNKLKNRLETAGCTVDASDDWLEEGNFTLEEKEEIRIEETSEEETTSDKLEQKIGIPKSEIMNVVDFDEEKCELVKVNGRNMVEKLLNGSLIALTVLRIKNNEEWITSVKLGKILTDYGLKTGNLSKTLQKKANETYIRTKGTGKSLKYRITTEGIQEGIKIIKESA